MRHNTGKYAQRVEAHEQAKAYVKKHERRFKHKHEPYTNAKMRKSKCNQRHEDQRKEKFYVKQQMNKPEQACQNTQALP